MDKTFLNRASGLSLRAGVTVCMMFLLLTAVSASKKNAKPAIPLPPDLLMDGNRKLAFENSFSSEKEVRGKPGFWTKVVDIVAGEPDYHQLIRPYGVAVDSRGRVIVTDPGAIGIHVFDFAQHKYKFIQRREKDTDPMLAPQCIAVDAEDNIYVTDSEVGKVFIFDASGKFRRSIGSLKGGEGYFKRPTGIAVDSGTQRIYVSDTVREKVFVLDMQGHVIKTIGQPGTGSDDFHYPTELRLTAKELIVVDAMNFRIRFLSRNGDSDGAFGEQGDALGQIFRPKGVGVDSEENYYVVEGLRGMVQVFDRQGRLLYYFGSNGTALGEFQLPSGLFIDRNDRIYVVDSFNHRIQVFRYYGLSKPAGIHLDNAAPTPQH